MTDTDIAYIVFEGTEGSAYRFVGEYPLKGKVWEEKWKCIRKALMLLGYPDVLVVKSGGDELRFERKR